MTGKMVRRRTGGPRIPPLGLALRDGRGGPADGPSGPAAKASPVRPEPTGRPAAPEDRRPGTTSPSVRLSAEERRDVQVAVVGREIGQRRSRGRHRLVAAAGAQAEVAT